MVSKIDALVMWTTRIDAMVAFYQALGLTLVPEQHGSGPVHYVTKELGAHFAIYALESRSGDMEGKSPGRAEPGGTQIGFQTDDIEALWSLVESSSYEVVKELETARWGRRFVVEDPDGRAVEVNQVTLNATKH